MVSYYELLGVPRNATPDEIRCAFKRKAHEAHPDKGGSQNEFLRLHNIYATLINPTTRKKYDIWLNVRENVNHTASHNENQTDPRNASHTPKLYFKLTKDLTNILESDPAPDNILGGLILHLAKSSDKYYSDIEQSDTQHVSAAKVIYSITTLLLRDGKYPKMDNVIFLRNYCRRIINNQGQQKDERPNNTKSNKLSLTSLYFIFLSLLFIGIGVLIIKTNKNLNDNSTPINSQITTATIPETDKNHDYNAAEKSDAPKVGEDYIDGRVFLPSDSIELELKRNSRPKVDNYDSRPTYSYKVTHFKNGDSPYASYFGKGHFDYESLSQLEVINYSSTNAVVLLITESGKVIRNVYVAKDSKYTLRHIPSSSCTIRVMHGNDWNNEKHNGENNPTGGFMKNVSITESQQNDPFDFYPQFFEDSIEYPTYSVTLHKVENGNFGSHGISIDEFFEK